MPLTTLAEIIDAARARVDCLSSSGAAQYPAGERKAAVQICGRLIAQNPGRKA